MFNRCGIASQIELVDDDFVRPVEQVDSSRKRTGVGFVANDNDHHLDGTNRCFAQLRIAASKGAAGGKNEQPTKWLVTR
jgi:hypothetical protein